MTSAPARERVSFAGGNNANCGYHLFNGMDAEFMATAAAFIGRYNATLSAPPAVASYRGLWWKAPGGSENGWSINFARQEKTIFGTWFAYDTTGTSCQ